MKRISLLITFLFFLFSLLETGEAGNFDQLLQKTMQKLDQKVVEVQQSQQPPPVPNLPPLIVEGPLVTTSKIATFARQSLSVIAMDSDGPNPLTYRWFKVSGPGRANFTKPNASQTEVSFDEAGTYVIQMACTDGINTITRNLTIRVYGVNKDWRIDAFNRSQNPYSPPSSYEDVPELILPPSGNENAPGLTFNEYDKLGRDGIYDDHIFYIVLGPCGNSHIKSIQFSLEGIIQTYRDVFNWNAPIPAVPSDKRPSHHGLAMVGHRYSSTSSYPGFMVIDHYGIRAMPLYNDDARLGTTFRITGYKSALHGETFPQINKVDFTIISKDELVVVVDITHPNFEAVACSLIKVESDEPTICDITMAIYPRSIVTPGELALWTFSSMNWKDTDPNNYAADCDTVVYGSGTDSIAISIDNPPPEKFTKLQLGSPEFVALKIVNGRTPISNSPYANARYWTRPDCLLTLFGDKTQLSWDLSVFHTEYEGADNVVLTGRNVITLAPTTRIENGYIFLSRLKVHRP